jgi:hypothetical protein
VTRHYIRGGPSTRGASTYKRAVRCLRFYAFGKVGKGTEPSEPMASGSVLHAGLAHFYARKGAAQYNGFVHDGRRFTSPNELVTVEEAMEISTIEERARGGEPNVEDVTKAVQHYVAKFANERLRVLSVEEEFKVQVPMPEGPPALYTSRIDLVTQSMQTGQVLIWDHKGTGRITRQQPGYYSVDLQFLGLRYIGQQLYGERFGGVVLNLVQRKDPYTVARPKLEPAPFLNSQFVQTVQDIETQIRWAESLNRAPEEWPAAPSELTCYHRYGPCSCLDFCRWGVGAVGGGGS